MIRACKTLLGAGASLLALSMAAVAADVEPPVAPLETTWSGSLTVNEYYTNNVFFSRPLSDEERQHDWVTVLLPALDLTLRFGDDTIVVGGNAEIGRFARHETENYEDFRLFADGRHRLDPVSLAIWGTSVLREHEPRSSPEPSDQVSATRRRYTGRQAAMPRCRARSRGAPSGWGSRTTTSISRTRRPRSGRDRSTTMIVTGTW